MSGRSFRSVFMVASCAGAALGCYLVSLRVASERAALEKVQTEIVLAQRDIRLLQTEIGTRGRLAQLERWNVKALALSAPSADQFLEGGFALAKMVGPRDKVDLEAPLVLAAAPANGPKPQIQGVQQQRGGEVAGVSARQMLHVASLKRETPPTSRDAPNVVAPSSTATKSVTDKDTARRSEKPAPTARTPAKTPISAMAKAKPAASAGKAAAADPLAPISGSSKPKKLASSTPTTSSRDNGTKQ